VRSRFDLLATSPAKAPLHADSLAFYADHTHKITPKPALTVASRWEMTQLSLDTTQSMTEFRVPLRMAPRLDPAAIRSSLRRHPRLEGLNYVYENGAGVGQPGPVPVARDGRLGAHERDGLEQFRAARRHLLQPQLPPTIERRDLPILLVPAPPR